LPGKLFPTCLAVLKNRGTSVLLPRGVEHVTIALGVFIITVVRESIFWPRNRREATGNRYAH